MQTEFNAVDFQAWTVADWRRTVSANPNAYSNYAAGRTDEMEHEMVIQKSGAVAILRQHPRSTFLNPFFFMIFIKSGQRISKKLSGNIASSPVFPTPVETFIPERITHGWNSGKMLTPHWSTVMRQYHNLQNTQEGDWCREIKWALATITAEFIVLTKMAHTWLDHRELFTYTISVLIG